MASSRTVQDENAELQGGRAQPLPGKLGNDLPITGTARGGAGPDFRSPINHKSNTLVMGLEGYHFAYYWKLGLPLIVIGVGDPVIFPFWPARSNRWNYPAVIALMDMDRATIRL